jgi:iron complex outermembrane receptor protein
MSGKSLLQTTTILGLGVLSLALPMQARAADASAQSANTIPEVVVTARRMEERLQDVPISISVFSQRELTNRGIISQTDLSTYTPSLSVNTFIGSNGTVFTLRGFGQDLQTLPSVAVYFNDVVAPRGGGVLRSGNMAPNGSFYDLQNVQVLKGPQGTLFGRNTTGGAVLLVPQKPSDHFEAYLESSVGNYGMVGFQGMVNVPVNDRLRLRGGFNQQTRDGYLENTTGIGPSRFGDVDFIDARISVDADITSNIENTLVGTYNNNVDHGPMDQLFSCAATPGAAGAIVYAPLSCAQLAANQGQGTYAVQNNAADPKSYARQWQIINTTTWRAQEHLSIKNIASYAQVKAGVRGALGGFDWKMPSTFFGFPTGPLAGSPIPFVELAVPLGGDNGNQETYSEELQFQGDAFARSLQWQAGIYLEGSNPVGLAGSSASTFLNCTDVQRNQCANTVLALFSPALGGSIQHTPIALNYHNYGFYEQATYKLNDQFRITEGFRYTIDVMSGEAQRQLITFPTPNTPVTSCFFASLNLPDCNQHSSQSSKAPTWLIGLDYTPNVDTLLYAKYARGYRQGGVNPNGPLGYTTFGPEHVDAYEVGEKYSFHGLMAGSINTAIFYNKLSSQQLAAQFVGKPGSGVQGVNGIVNIGQSRIWGIEFQGILQPATGWTVDVGYAYLNTKLLSAPPIVLSAADVYGQAIPSSSPGDPLPLSPPHKVTATVTYKLPLDPSIGDVTLGTNYTWVSDNFQTGGGLFPKIPAYGLLNFNVNWEHVAGKPFDLEFFMSNATDKFYVTNLSDYSNTLGGTLRMPGPPRMFGVRARAHFN